MLKDSKIEFLTKQVPNFINKIHIYRNKTEFSQILIILLEKYTVLHLHNFVK